MFSVNTFIRICVILETLGSTDPHHCYLDTVCPIVLGIIFITSLWTFCFTRRFFKDQSVIAGESVYVSKKKRLFGIFGSTLLIYGICFRPAVAPFEMTLALIANGVVLSITLYQRKSLNQQFTGTSCIESAVPFFDYHWTSCWFFKDQSVIAGEIANPVAQFYFRPETKSVLVTHCPLHIFILLVLSSAKLMYLMSMLNVSNVIIDQQYSREPSMDGNLTFTGEFSGPAVAAVLTVEMILALIANGVVLSITLCRRKSLKQSSTIFFTSLILAHLVLNLLYLPFRIIALAAGEWIFGSTDEEKRGTCRFFDVFIYIWMVLVISMTLAAISFDRFLFIVKPHLHKRFMRPWVALTLTVAIWILSAVLSSIYSFGFQLKFDSHYNCSVTISISLGVSAIILAFIFNGIIFITSLWTFCFTRRFFKDQSVIAGESVYASKEKRLFGIFGCMLLVYAICFVPGVLYFLLLLFINVPLWLNIVFTSYMESNSTFSDQFSGPAVAAVLIVEVILALIANGVVLSVTLYQRKSLKQPSTIFFTSLILAHLVFNLLFVPFIIIGLAASEWISDSTDEEKRGTCYFFLYIYWWILPVISITLAAISFDRFLFIVKPHLHKQFMRPWVALILTIAIWILSAVLSIVHLFGLRLYTDICLSSSADIGFVVYFILLLAIVLGIIFILSLWTFCFTRRFFKDQSVIAGESVYASKKKRLFGIFGCMLLIHGICFIPGVLYFLLLLFIDVPLWLNFAAIICFHFVTVANPVMQSYFRPEIKSVLFRRPLHICVCC
uniref:G-protein coupled receptors family 1 profile domain-containing protein n=1 Tax=Amphimedon queenslandica TaxID=400682 RepID=A0A1X7V7V6_AMPQE